MDDDTPEMLALELVKQRGRLLAASPEARTLENIDTPTSSDVAFGIVDALLRRSTIHSLHPDNLYP